MNRLIAFTLRERWLMVVVLIAVLGIGYFSFRALNIDAYPDPVPPLVEVVTLSSGQSAEEIERYVTIPIEIQMAGIPNVTAVRTISLFGLSDVKVQFTYAFSYDEAEQRVINRLTQLSPLPNGATPQISPESPIGEVYRYRVVGPPGYSITDLKTLQDWVLQRRFKAVPGVIDVIGWGGQTKTYDVKIDNNKLLASGITLAQVLQVIGNSNINVGGQTVNFGEEAAIVRGVGLIHSQDQLRRTMLASNTGVPVFVGDVATVEPGHQPRLGIAGQDGENDIVEGIVLMHRGEKSSPTIRAIEEQVRKVNSTGVLPPGVRIEPIYDRSDLVRVTTNTVLQNLLYGIILIFLVQWLFLGSLRSAIVVAATIPFALAFAILLLTVTGQSANLLSIGAIDFGLVVDATVIMVENVYRHLAEAISSRRTSPSRRLRGRSRLTGKLATIFDGAHEVTRPILFSAAIIIASFVPLFTLTGIEGHIFGPMAKTYAYAIAGGLLATFTISPALSALLLQVRLNDLETFVVRWMTRLYQPIVAFALGNRIVVLGGLAIAVLAALLAGRSLGLEYLPHLEEGNFWIRATMPQAVSLEASDGYVNRIRAAIKEFSEVDTVVSQHGRPDDGTDATGFFNAEFFAVLKPARTWPKGVDKPKLTQELSDKLNGRFPGVSFNFSQYIEDNIEEYASGVKGENSVKLFGPGLKTLENVADQIKDAMASVRGITDLDALTSLGQPNVTIEVDRARAARYGLTPGDVNATVQAAIGGQAAGNLFEEGSDRNFPIVVRLAPQFRRSLIAIRRIAVAAPATSGNGFVQVPLSDVADVRLDSGASFIYRENQERYIPVKFSVRERDLGGAVLEAQRRVGNGVRLPGGYHLEWVGELGELNEALARLAIVIPASLLLVGILLFIHFSSLTDTLLAASVLPMALIGGTFALFVTRTPMSVSAAMGFVALFGIAVMNGIIVLSSFNGEVESGKSRSEALLRTCETKLRPVLMTCIVASVGLLPAAISNGIGAQVQKPLAIVVVGGTLLAPLFILIVLPVLIEMFSRRGIQPRAELLEE